MWLGQSLSAQDQTIDLPPQSFSPSFHGAITFPPFFPIVDLCKYFLCFGYYISLLADVCYVTIQQGVFFILV